MRLRPTGGKRGGNPLSCLFKIVLVLVLVLVVLVVLVVVLELGSRRCARTEENGDDGRCFARSIRRRIEDEDEHEHEHEEERDKGGNANIRSNR